ncbi:CLUMA_CG007350, isoform A [Clunio marinus]|uniref:CLUMA_CG007350, isoform A n=1 Tax=Clunio marinus TaxID=568069 RepID=A0A1J1I0F3_9DIPT|nr:CLUMA_CG007350, isoform A [Clunio marinus]
MFINFFCSNCGHILKKSSSLRLFHTSHKRLSDNKNYYEILGLKNDCTQKEIRNAFVTLSKAHHPDLNLKSTDSKSNQDFIKVMEAYQVLSKIHSRSNYDLSLRGIDTVNYIKRDTIYEPWKVDPSSYSEKGPSYSPYYGVKGINKMKNWKIVMACAIFCAFGVLVQVLAISNSMTFRREQLDRTSAAYSKQHEELRNKVKTMQQTEHIENMEKRLK